VTADALGSVRDLARTGTPTTPCLQTVQPTAVAVNHLGTEGSGPASRGLVLTVTVAVCGPPGGLFPASVCDCLLRAPKPGHATSPSRRTPFEDEPWHTPDAAESNRRSWVGAGGIRWSPWSPATLAATVAATADRLLGNRTSRPV